MLSFEQYERCPRKSCWPLTGRRLLRLSDDCVRLGRRIIHLDVHGVVLAHQQREILSGKFRAEITSFFRTTYGLGGPAKVSPVKARA